ncbi:Uma2 family endonuclease [Coleofasciculus sp. H7-2]|uniref:Uma2 family endonuclease n=1 Tax=Coleofasciculus sp. H7-2 TaxID=3351545 RepID=UPI0036705D26
MVTAAVVPANFSLEDFMRNPPEKMEWVDGELVEKNGVTLKHSKIQLRLGSDWRDYMISSGQGGEAYTDVPCRTNKQGRRPDVAYITPELLEQYGEFETLPQSFPLVAEIVSPTDLGEDIFLKAREYLDSGCLEVWLVFPESRWIIVITQTQALMLTTGEVISTQTVLPGFNVAVDELLA